MRGLSAGAILKNTPFPVNGQVAQSVEQRIENPRVGGSIPLLATSIYAGLINQAFPHRGTVTKA